MQLYDSRMTIDNDADVNKAREKYKVLYEHFRAQFENEKTEFF